MIIKGKVEEILPHVDMMRETTALAGSINVTVLHVVTNEETTVHVDTTTTTGVLEDSTTETRVPADTIQETTRVDITRPSINPGLTTIEMQEDMPPATTLAAKANRTKTSPGTRTKITLKTAKQNQALARTINSISKASVTDRRTPMS